MSVAFFVKLFVAAFLTILAGGETAAAGCLEFQNERRGERRESSPKETQRPLRLCVSRNFIMPHAGTQSS